VNSHGTSLPDTVVRTDLLTQSPRYIPPKLNLEKSNIKNSENTALFLTSCFEYILSGVVLNAGPPFREAELQNCKPIPIHHPMDKPSSSASNAIIIGPFVATIAIALVFTLYMVLIPAKWLKHIMQLTHTSWDYRLLIVVFGICYLAVAWVGEKYVFQRLARLIGRAKQAITKRPKKRKEYKLIQERMLF
jgi:cation-transporting ATPase 13A3/4/5